MCEVIVLGGKNHSEEVLLHIENQGIKFTSTDNQEEIEFFPFEFVTKYGWSSGLNKEDYCFDITIRTESGERSIRIKAKEGEKQVDELLAKIEKHVQESIMKKDTSSPEKPTASDLNTAKEQKDNGDLSFTPDTWNQNPVQFQQAGSTEPNSNQQACQTTVEAIERARSHYDAHARKGQQGFVSSEQQLQERSQGPAYPLKRYHNQVKRALIRRFAWQADRLLDLGCGRGGDLHKWIAANVNYVKGVDISSHEIEEAKRRYQEQKNRDGEKLSLIADFEVTEQLGLSDYDARGQDMKEYDVVTIMFALHYFFVTESSIKRFLENVVLNLKEGGYFIGTVPDGRRVLEKLAGQTELYSDMLTIKSHWGDKEADAFGSGYSCAIRDTVTEDIDGNIGSHEYLVFNSVLEGLARQYNLVPIHDYDDADLQRLVDYRGQRVLKGFTPYFRNSHKSLEWASEINTSFVFQKLTQNQETGERMETYLPPKPPIQDDNYLGKRKRHFQDNQQFGKRRRNHYGDGGGGRNFNQRYRQDDYYGR
eukprot:TRINITY_DN84410_c0_g1_i1.p1 TRINITY_DN84410_c0_g1~~TRINITY_DN84410_c0_g1_i1.p1  ORF type:complete len:535 (-),score=75.56 TRINITY_DN84410_c0_g1_i1:227-1831(-)